MNATEEQAPAAPAVTTAPAWLTTGWQPVVGWLCAVTCAANWLGIPALRVGLLLAGQPVPAELQPADLTEMLSVMLGLLGLGGLKTVERLSGKA